MQPVDQFPIYELGGALAQLKHTAQAVSRGVESGKDHLGTLYWADYHITRLLDGIPLHISFARARAQSVHNKIAELVERLQRTSADDEEVSNALAARRSEPKWQWSFLAQEIEVFEHQFSAELQNTATYAVPERGIFKTESLVSIADRHIHESVRNRVPPFAISEFQSAGRCLAFGLCSASGFHSARAVESMLRDYHKAYLPKRNPETLTMGQMASALADMHKAKKQAEALPSLNTVRHIKDFTDYDRNPLMHKTVVLEEIDAVTLFNSAASVIVEMAKELDVLKAVSAFSVVAPFAATSEEEEVASSEVSTAASSDGQAS